MSDPTREAFDTSLNALLAQARDTGAAEQAAIDAAAIAVKDATIATQSAEIARLNALIPPPSFTLGTTKPDATNTGIPAGTALTKRTGDVTITTDGATVDALDIYGHLYIKANNVKVTRCRVRGWADGGFHTYGLISCEAGKTGITIDFCELVPDVPTWWLVGIRGCGFKATRNNIHRVVDGVVLFGANPGVVEGNYVHDLSFFNNSGDQANDPYHPGWTHNDGVQIEGGSGHRIVGNTLRAYASPVVGHPSTLTSNGFPNLERPVPITVSPYKSPATGCVIEQNWLEGGEASFQMNELNAGANQNLGRVARNRLDGGQHRWSGGGWYGLRYKKGITIDGIDTNVWDDAANVPAALRGTIVKGDPGIHVDG